MSDRAALERLAIKAYERPDYSGQPVDQFDAYLYPNAITIAYEAEFDGAGTASLPLTFFIDGIDASGRPIDLQRQVERFHAVTGYNGNIQRPNYLKLVWGTLRVKRCVLKSASIAYKLFMPDGMPLRAVVTATFADSADEHARSAAAADRRTDLTRVRLVNAGDTLPLLCHEIYGDPLLYLEVAQANRIDDFRALVPGSRIFFPPLEK